MKIAIIGSGIVGQDIGQGFSKLGHEVNYYDTDAEKLKDLNKQGCFVSYSITEVTLMTDMCFICVPTPYNDGIDLSYIKSSVGSIAKALKGISKWYLVVIKSTVLPKTAEDVILPILRENKVNFGLCVNPEFLTQSHSSWTDDKKFRRDFGSEDRIVIGEFDKKSGDVLESIYKPIGAPIYRMSLREAEMCKYAANMMLATKISYWNEIFLYCKELGIDSNLVAEVVSRDNRIGKYGTVHGKAYGGKCLDKDLKSFIKEFVIDKEMGYVNSPSLLFEVDQINEYMRINYGVRE